MSHTILYYGIKIEYTTQTSGRVIKIHFGVYVNMRLPTKYVASPAEPREARTESGIVYKAAKRRLPAEAPAGLSLRRANPIAKIGFFGG